MSNTQAIYQRCVKHREFARANMELAAAEYEEAISKIVCDTLHITSMVAEGIIENARKKRKLNEDVKPDEDIRKNELLKEDECEEDDDDEHSDDNEEEEEIGKGG